MTEELIELKKNWVGGKQPFSLREKRLMEKEEVYPRAYLLIFLSAEKLGWKRND